MGFLDGVPFFGRDKENQVLVLIRKHMVVANKSVVALSEFFDAVAECDKETAKAKLAEIRKQENDADTFVHSIEELLYSGAFLPLSRSRIIVLVERVDDIVDESKDAASIAMHMPDMKYDPVVVQLLKRMTVLGIEATELLLSAYDALQERPEDTKDLLKQIADREAQADQLKGELYTKLYELNDPILLFLIAGIADATAGLTDAAENASDVLNIMLITGTA
jgi:hypothetical protein